MSTGLMAIGFRVNSDNVDEMYLDRVNTTVQAGMRFIDPSAIAFLWDNVQSEEFEQAR